MRVLSKLTLAASLASVVGLLSAAPLKAQAQAPAQGQKLVAREGAIELMLLLQKSVRDDIKLNMQEISKIDEFCAKQWAHAQEIHKLPEDQQKAKYEALGKENKQFIGSTLTQPQQQRLNQIALQVAGLAWVLDPSVSGQLMLNEQQKMKILEMQKQAHQQLEAVFANPNQPGFQQKLDELHAEHGKQLMSVLNDQQKAKLKELGGAPFTGKLVFANFEPKK